MLSLQSIISRLDDLFWCDMMLRKLSMTVFLGTKYYGWLIQRLGNPSMLTKLKIRLKKN
jgi:hypothetical protein